MSPAPIDRARARLRRLSRLLLVLCGVAVMGLATAETGTGAKDSDVEVMQGFAQQELEVGKAVAITDHEKQVVMFTMGIALLILLVTTAVFGIAMAIYGKQVFVAHMVCAGLSVTLALAHAVVAIVWFFPF